MAVFARDLAMYIAVVSVLAWSDAPLVVLPAWLVAASTISGLFVLGHDAAHAALFRSARLNYAIGQLAMLPSLHAFSVWAYGHNRIHHPFAACQGLDFVWHPATPAQYARLGPLAKLLHRIEWSALGGGVYYARALWWGKIVRGAAPPRLRAAFRRDRLAVAAFFAVATALLLAAGWQRAGVNHTPVVRPFSAERRRAPLR